MRTRRRVVVGGLGVALFGSVIREIRLLGEGLMAQLEGINSALEDLSAQITQVADQIAGLSAGSITQAQLDEVESKIRGMAGRVDELVEEEGEDAAPESPSEGEQPAEGEPPPA